MQAFFDQVWQTVGGFVPNLIGAILVLFLGWLIALIVSAVVRAIFNRTTLDNRLATSLGLGKDDPDFKIEQIISKTVFWLIMLFVFVAVFQILGLTIITQPLNALLSAIVGFGSNLLAAGVLILIAWAVATLVKFVLTKVLGAIFNPADFLYNIFGKKPRELRKLRQMKEDDEIRNLLASRFDREMLTALLQIDRVDLDLLVSECNYSKDFIRTANDLQILDAISECYEEYKVLQRRGNRLNP